LEQPTGPIFKGQAVRLVTTHSIVGRHETSLSGSMCVPPQGARSLPLQY